MFRPLVITAAVLALLGGCSKQEAQAPAAAPAVAPVQAAQAAPAEAPAVQAPAAAQVAAVQPAPAAPAAAAAPAPAPVPAAKPQAQGQTIDIMGGGSPRAAVPTGHNRGKVTQTQNGGGYTYAEVVMASGQKVWIAGSQIDVKPGAEVEWGNYSLMRDFTARSLGRTFQEILFVDRWAPVGQAPVAVAPHGTFPNGQPATAAAGNSADAMAAAAAGMNPAAAGSSASGTVKSVTAAGGYSYIEVDQGGGKTVWVAAMETPMKKGDKVQWEGGTQMSNFTARSLGRTFDKIIFAQSVAVGK